MDHDLLNDLPFRTFQIDETGCPAVFERKCKCGIQKYKYWRPDDEVSAKY